MRQMYRYGLQVYAPTANSFVAKAKIFAGLFSQFCVVVYFTLKIST
jgi:hypothetical protein